MEEADIKLCNEMADAIIEYRTSWDEYLETELSPDQKFVVYDLYAMLHSFPFKFNTQEFHKIIELIGHYTQLLSICYPVDNLQHMDMRKYREMMGEVGKIMKEKGHGDLLGDRVESVLDSYRQKGDKNIKQPRGVYA
jgi:hypothetical protein